MDGNQSEKRSKNSAVSVLILAAGRGERAGQSEEGPKQYRNLAGSPVITRTLQAFQSHPRVNLVAVCIHRDDKDLFDDAVGDIGSDVVVVHGGNTRQVSTILGLEALEPHNPEIVLIHDGVRPFIDQSMIDRILASLDGGCGAIPAMPVSDTLKHNDINGFIAKTVPRDNLFAAQTPQAFPFDAILKAHRSARADDLEDFTDDAAIAEWAGLPVKIVAGSSDNIKLTFARDFELANEKLAGSAGRLPDVRTGNGYDVHAFEAGNSVTLCGVSIPYERSLSGHSDADVGLHALTDALLATCGAGDIGTHFPPTDDKWKNADSRIFIEHASQMVNANGGRISNVDITLICEAPKIGPHREPMVAAVANMLSLSPHRVSIKATTNERLGFVGRGEGIAAIATATVVFAGSL